MENLTWTCHVCGEERGDRDIGVRSFPMKNLPGAEMNIRYCLDNLECWNGAYEAGLKGEFPLIKRKSRKPWWKF